jgi:hypothetical protein
MQSLTGNTEGIIYAQMAKVMADTKAVPKSGYNQAQRFNFRTVDDTVATVNAAMVKHRVTMIPEVISCTPTVVTDDKGRHVTTVNAIVAYTFFAEDGSSIQAVMAGEGKDLGDKATSKAMSMALKYALFQVFLIPTGDPDPDGEVVETATADGMMPTPAAKKALLAALGGDREAAKEAWGDRTEPISTEDLNHLINYAKETTK